MASASPTFSFSGTPTITTAKLNWKNYLSWSTSVELWFLGQGYQTTWKKELVLFQMTRDLSGKNLTFNYVLCRGNLLSRMFWKSLDHSKHVLFGRRPKRYLQMIFKVFLMQPKRLLHSNRPTMICLHI